MNFNLIEATAILSRTPGTLDAMLRDMPDSWSKVNEGNDTWSPYEVLGHLIHGEKTDWIPRMEIMLSNKADRQFEPFDRFAMLKLDKSIPLNDLLDEFSGLRKNNLKILESKNLTEEMLSATGIHPEFGEVPLKKMLAAWVVHDLGHVYQITRVMAKQYKNEAGPWIKYLRVLNE